MDDDLNDDDGSIWVRTEPTLDGKGFIVTLSLGSDYAVTLTPTRAMAYASTLLAAVADAEYDHAIMRQLTKDGNDEDPAIWRFITDFRKDRPRREGAGLVFEGGVAYRNKLPFIAIKDQGGKGVGQLNPAKARRHALDVLEARIGADLDATYLRMLRADVGLEESVARAAVAQLGEHRLDPLIEIDT